MKAAFFLRSSLGQEDKVEQGEYGGQAAGLAHCLAPTTVQPTTTVPSPTTLQSPTTIQAFTTVQSPTTFQPLTTGQPLPL